MQALYFKRQWDESSGDELTDSWGTSTYYFETDTEYSVLRQLEIFENGKVLKYDTNYLDDKFGGLSEVPLDPEEFAEYQILQEEFEYAWNNTQYRRFPEIVCTADVLWGQPRLEGRRLAVGDIVSLINIYHEDIHVTMKDFELTIQQIRQALHYCKDLQCKSDQPEKYCHNCLLRIYQFNEAIDESDPEQPYWQTAEKLYQRYFANSQLTAQHTKILEWLQIAFEEPVGGLNECYYFDKTNNEFFSVFITDYFLVVDDGVIAEMPYTPQEFSTLKERLIRLEHNDASIISIPRLSVEERKEIVRKFVNLTGTASPTLMEQIDNELGRSSFNWNDQFSAELINQWNAFKQARIREKIASFCDQKDIDISTAMLWTDKKTTTINLDLTTEKDRKLQTPTGKPWWKFW